MKEDLRKILQKLVPEFLKANADPDIMRAKLHASDDLIPDECDMIQCEKIRTEKFNVMFTLLKSKSENVMRRLQEICIETNWIDLYELIQSNLASTDNGHLTMTKAEFISYQQKHRNQSVAANEQLICFDIRDPTEQFVGREPQLIAVHELMQRSAKKDGTKGKKIVITERSTTVTGLGGIGKTQLALKYVQLYSEEYGNRIVWINAESDSTLRDSFQRLAQMNNINTKNDDGMEKDTSIIIQDVYRLFSNAKCLFVFDSADKPLNGKFYPGGPTNKIYILITSRYQNWGDIEVFQLDNFTLEEATEFIINVLDIKVEDGKGNDVVQLARTLYCFPLAIKQATSYIKETNRKMGLFSKSFMIADYLKTYNDKKEELLNYKFFNEFGNQYSQTTFTTWSITINEIDKDENDGKLALSILNGISYLSTEKIDPNIFLIEGNELKIASAIEKLQLYSMVDLNKNMLYVHLLVQDVTQLKFEQKNLEEETFAKVCQSVEKYFPQLISSHNYVKQKQVLPHLEKLLEKIKGWLEKNHSQRKRVEREYVRNLLVKMFLGFSYVCECQQKHLIFKELLIIETEQYGTNYNYLIAISLMHLGIAFASLGFSAKMKTLLEGALTIVEKHYGPDHYEVAKTLVDLGNAYGNLGDSAKQKTLLERALTIQEKHYGPNHDEVAKTLMNLGNAYGRLGDSAKQKTLLERVLTIQEKHYGADHDEVAITLVNLGNAYGRLGDSAKQKTLLERALTIQEKYYGPVSDEAALTLVDLGGAYGRLGDSAKQKTLLERALTILKKHYRPEHYEVAKTLVNLGNAYDNLGDSVKQKLFWKEP